MSDRAINHDLPEDIRPYLGRSERFVRIEADPEDAPGELRCYFDTRWYPATVSEASLTIRWRVNNDFELHYREVYTDGDNWECRWDRHPNEHNTRDHYHPGPDAARDAARDASFPIDWRDVTADVLSEIDSRQRAFWS